MSIDSNGVVTNEALARYDAGIKDIIAMRTAEKNPVRYKVVKSTSTGSQTYSFYKKDENDTDFVVDSTSDAITVQDSIDSTSKDPVNGVAVAAKFAEQMTTQNINSIIGYTPMDSSIKGAANGVASLDGLGQVPVSQLPVVDTYSATGTKPINGAGVAAALATLPEPMVFKGTVGTGGTVTSLPTAANSNKGHTYKAISDNIVSGSKIGDTFISTGSAWVTIPSGDEPSGTVTQVGINASSGSHLSASGTVTSSGNLTVGVESGYQIPTSSDVSQITTNKTNILYAINNGVKNELDNFGTTSYERSGVTFTFNKDGSVHIKGTATGANANFYYYTGTYSYISNIYKGHILSGVTGGAEGTYGLLAQYSNNGTSWATQEMCKTAPITIKSDYNYVNICIIVFSGQTVDTTIYPMLCDPTVWAQSHDFMPPALPNYDLTRLEAEDRASLAEVVDSGAKNLVDWRNTVSFQNVTIDNGTYTTSGDSLTTLRFQVAAIDSNGGQIMAFNGNGTIPTANGVINIPFTVPSGTAKIRAGHNGSTYNGRFDIPLSGTTLEVGKSYVLQVNVTQYTNSSGIFKWKDLMICTKAAFGVSTKFVPYTKSNSQLTTELGSVKTVLEAIL